MSWDNFGTKEQIMANTVSAGRDYSFGQQSALRGIIPEGTGRRTFQIPVSITNTTDLTASTSRSTSSTPTIPHLGLILIAPSGDMFTLLLNQVPVVGGTADTGIGIGGSNLGVMTYTNNNIATYAMGTTFDDNATRDIFDPTTAGTNAISGPAIGDYQPENNAGDARRVPRSGAGQGHQRHLDARDQRHEHASDHPADDPELPH